MNKKNEIICSPKNSREMLVMTAAIVYLESSVRDALHKHKKVTLEFLANCFLNDVEDAKLTHEY